MRWLGAVGRQSLQVFRAGLLLSYGAALALHLLPGWAPWLNPMLIAGGAALLVAYAWLLDRT